MGNKLFTQVTGLTGLPEELIGEELKTLLERKGVAPEQVTMESLREALADYLNQMAEEFADSPDLLDELPATSSSAMRSKLS
ncbi:MAG: hypothetical protein ACXVB9_12075 [Bdellovibrionota bacterium]